MVFEFLFLIILLTKKLMGYNLHISACLPGVPVFRPAFRQTMVRGPPVILEICPCGPSRNTEEELKFKWIAYHYSWKSQRLEMPHGNRLSLSLPVPTFHSTLNNKIGIKSPKNVVFLAIFSLHIWRRAYTPAGTARIHNRGPKYRSFSCIYDILNSFSDNPPIHWNGHIIYLAQ